MQQSIHMPRGIKHRNDFYTLCFGIGYNGIHFRFGQRICGRIILSPFTVLFAIIAICIVLLISVFKSALNSFA